MPKHSRRNTSSVNLPSTLSVEIHRSIMHPSPENRKSKVKREWVKTKVQCMVCSFSVHWVQYRREEVSVQLHAEQLKDRAEVIPAISLLHALPTPRPGCCHLGNGFAGQRWNSISSVSRGSTSA